MSVEATIDNDVLIKCACYQMLDDVVDGLGGPGSVGVLGAARFVVGAQLARRHEIRDDIKARAHFDDFLTKASELEPSDEEIDMATAIEEMALGEGLPIDEGESQLCAILVFRSLRALVTGDKRAIQSLEDLSGRVGGLDRISAKLASLEQLVLAVVQEIGPSEARMRVCAEPEVDRAMSACFECTAVAERAGFVPDGLLSYIDDLRTKAPTVLWPKEPLFRA